MIKNYFLSLIILLSFSVHGSCQDFAPIGAKWHYEHRTLGRYTDYNLLKVEKDTLIKGKSCRVLSKSINECSNTFEYVYSDSNIYFIYNQSSLFFDTLYNFNANTGESWWNGVRYIKVDSVVYQIINGKPLKGLYVDGQTYKGPIFEVIGSPYSFFYDNQACDPVNGGWLRCYEDSSFGLYNTTGVPCDTIYTSVHVFDFSMSDVMLFPNPFTNYLSIHKIDKQPIKIEIYNIFGEVLKQQKYEDENITIDFDFILPGVYFIKIYNNENYFTSKLIKVD